MNNKFLKVASVIATASLLSFGAQAAIDTEVQYSSTGAGTGVDGSYDITGITSFDYRDDASLVIRDAGVTVVGQVGTTTLSSVFSAPVVGTTFSFDFHYQTILTGMTSGSPNPAIDDDGTDNGDTGFEVTMLMSARETATIISNFGGQVIIAFTGISGSFEMFHDESPDADLVAGTGFGDGTKIMEGTLDSIVSFSSFGSDGVTGSGSSFIGQTITGYDDAYIQADPDAGAPLVGADFGTTIDLDFGAGIQNMIANGSKIGIDQYTVDTDGINPDDLVLKADASQVFMVNDVPEPSTLFLLGAGLLMFGGVKQRKA